MPCCILVVNNLDASITTYDLKKNFNGHGKILIISKSCYEDFGIVEMHSPDEAKKAKEALNGKEIKGRYIEVDYLTDRHWGAHI